MANWKKFAGIGVAAGVLLGLLFAAFSKSPLTGFSEAQANGWNSHAIQSTLAGVRVQEIDPTHAAVVFLYDLQNETNADYRLASGPNIVIMTRIDPGGSLSSDRQPSLTTAAFLPAKTRVRMSLEMNRSFNWPGQRDAAAERALRQLVADAVSGLDGFVLFDQATRYQIEFPTASPETQRSPNATSPN